MNRCPTRLPRRHLIAAALLIAGGGTVLAQEATPRSFPEKALRGTLVVLQPPEITMDGRPARLSPGSRIRGANNMLVLSGALVNQTLTVNYTVDTVGLVHDVWILTEIHEVIDLSTSHHGAATAPSPRKPRPGEACAAIWSRWPILRRIETADPTEAVCVEVACPDGPLLVYGSIIP